MEGDIRGRRPPRMLRETPASSPRVSIWSPSGSQRSAQSGDRPPLHPATPKPADTLRTTVARAVVAACDEKAAAAPQRQLSGVLSTHKMELHGSQMVGMRLSGGIVKQVVKGQAAEAAGLVVGMQVRNVNGRHCTTDQEVAAAMVAAFSAPPRVCFLEMFTSLDVLTAMMARGRPRRTP